MTPAKDGDREAENVRVWRWREAICADAGLSAAVKLVALRLSFHYDLDRRNVWCPQDRLAVECAVHEVTVQRARRLLVDRGALRVIETPHRNRAARYGLISASEWDSAPVIPMKSAGTAPELPQDELGQRASRIGAAPESNWDSAPVELGQRQSCVSSSLVIPKGSARGTTKPTDPAETGPGWRPAASPDLRTVEDVIADMKASMGRSASGGVLMPDMAGLRAALARRDTA